MSNVWRPTKKEISEVLRLHKLWLADGGGGNRDVLRYADLRYADLSSADLRYAVLPTGERFESYLSDVVPALLAAGGRPVEELVPSFSCHKWANCPMHEAFGIERAADGPPLLVPRIEQFVHLFDAGQIPAPVRGEDGKWRCPVPEYKKPD